MNEEKTFYRHNGVRSHDVGYMADDAKNAAQVDHDEVYGRAGTFEFLRIEDYKQKNWLEQAGTVRKHRCTMTVIWQHHP